MPQTNLGLRSELGSGGEMGDGAADERLRSVVPRLEHGRQEMASLPIPDELMVEIFLRLPTPADLARASATCVSFRRLTADRSFLRRYRKLHAPPLLGFLEKHRVFYPAIAPHPSASAATAVASAADFSFSFLPAPCWVVHDIRDGRVLLCRLRRRGTNVFTEQVVCDPLHRRYLLLPQITCDPLLIETKQVTDMFLAPPGDDVDEAAAAEQDTSFRVVWMAQCKTRLVAFVFSSNTGQWRAVPSLLWSDLFAGWLALTATNLFYSRQYAYGCFYWVANYREESKLLVLHTESMEFSNAEFPPEAKGSRDLAMVEAGEGRIGMFVLTYGASDISYLIRKNDHGSSSQWQKVKTISLGFETFTICNMEKYLLLYQWQGSLPEAGCSMLNIETFQLEKVCALGSNICKLHAYSNFPPSLLSLPRISSGVEEGFGKEMLEQGCAASSSAESPR